MTINASSIIDAVAFVTRHWTRQRKAEERELAARQRRTQAMTRPSKVRKVVLKEAVFAEMLAGAHKASGGGRTIFPKRNLYYSVRKLIQSRTSEELSYSYFEGILDDWVVQYGPLPGLYCDPRGYFIEPHTGKVVPLGTREVDAYSIPLWLFSGVLYVEKKGFHELFQLSRIAERYDLGIICAEGYAPDAAKLLLSRAEQSSGMKILCLHDADPFGYNISRCLTDDNRIDVIDMGMSLGDALEMGLPTEEFTRDKALPSGLELNDLEREYFEGVHNGWRERGKKTVPVYRCRRVELNALAADLDLFLAYVERKLKEHGCAEKLVPPKQVLLDRAKAVRSKLLQQASRKELANLLDEDTLVSELVAQFSSRITVKDMPKVLAGWAEGMEAKSWDAHLEDLLRARTEALVTELANQVLVKTRAIAERL